MVSGYHMVFLWFSYCFPWFSYGFPMDPHGFCRHWHALSLGNEVEVAAEGIRKPGPCNVRSGAHATWAGHVWVG